FKTNLIGTPPLSRHHRSVMRDLTMQVLPLRADMARMRQFINSYLNFVDDPGEPPPLYFKPAMPYVMLQVMHYPYLAVTADNTTWLQQHEVAFCVPLECYTAEGGRRIFLEYATCVPFLYLDMQPTIISGRDIFGLPKVALRFELVQSPNRPSEPTQIANLSLRCPGPNGDESKKFLQIFREAPRG